MAEYRQRTRNSFRWHPLSGVPRFGYLHLVRCEAQTTAVSLILGEAPLARAPSIERRQFVPWFALNDRDLLSGVELLSPELMLAASSLHDAHSSRALREWVRNTLGLGWALHPQLELLQLTADFIDTRAEKYRSRLLVQRSLLVEAIGDIDFRAVALSRRQARDASACLLQRAISALGTALITGAFVYDEASPRLLGNNLALLDGAIAEFEEEHLADPASDKAMFAMPRQLFAGVTIHASLLREKRFAQRVLDELLDRSEGLSGYWLQVPGVNSGSSAATLESVRDFAYPLQERSERPVVTDRLGSFGLGLLAGGIAGYCVGTAAPEFVTFPPLSYRARDIDGFAFVSYNQVLLRNFQLRGARARRGLLAAHRYPCSGCGHHDPDAPPQNNREKKLHGFAWHREQALRLSAGASTQTGAQFLQMVGVAQEASRAIKDPAAPFYAAMLATLPPALAARTGTD